MQMDDIQSWWEVPSIAHFCSLFRAAFNLLDFDIEELEEALLTDGTEDSGSSLLQELIVRILCGCYKSHDVTTSNYQMFLRRQFRQKCQEYGRNNPFNTDMDFQFLPLRTKVEILHELCDFRLDGEDVQELLKNLEADSLRVEPLGRDENNSAYWYFYGTRLYREDFPKTPSKKKTKEKRKKGEKKKKKHCRSGISLGDGERGIWHVVCFTEADWHRITLGFKNSRSRAEKELYHTLSEDFLPEIPRLFAEKERLQRKRLMEYQPRRQSSRLEKLKQQREEEQSQKSHEKEVKQRHKQERGKKEKMRQSRYRKEGRASRARMRSQSTTNSECGSVGSLVDSVAESKSGQSTAFVGRQTNNSLSSATGQIFIQGLRRKLRSSQVFRQTEEDLQTGMYKILEFIKNHEDAWPFLEPVDEEYAPRYYSIIHRPMDIQRMEDKLDEGEYMSFLEFKSDFQLIVDNCRKYNGTDNEYTEMVGNLQQAFQSAVDRYLESEPSSDEEIAVEFIEKEPEKPSSHSSKKTEKRSPPKKKKEVVPIPEEPVRSPSLSPSLPPSSPSSDEEDISPEVEKDADEISEAAVEVPDSDESSTKDEAVPNHNGTKRKKKSGTKNAPDIEALELATEQTLKDINKWLDDTPRYSEFSSASNSPSHFISTEEYEAGSRVENEYRRNIKMEKPSRSKDSKDNSKRRPNKDLTKQMRRREVQRTIERLQPGKSKGNLISNIQSAGKVSEEGPPGKPKDTRSSLFPVTDEAIPKLSLGTVLGTDVLGFGVGQSKHNFDAETKEEEETTVLVAEEPPKPVIDVRPTTPEAPLEIELTEECTEKKEKEEIEAKIVTKDCRQEKTMPNLSAWFKAFGAPKSTSSTKKRPESLQDGLSNEIINTEERRDVANMFVVETSADKNVTVETPTVIVHDMSRQSVVVEQGLEEANARCSQQLKDNRDDEPSPIPLTSNQQSTARQRKVSTGSSISERSSFSQDLMDPVDGSSPRLSLDERLGSYSAPYPSPMHQSPISASPVIASPKPEEGPKFASYPPLNGTIRVGFYQDTSFSLQKNSPEKTNNRSHSPKEQTPGPLPTYSPRMYPPHDPGGFLSYQNQQSGPQTPAADASYENSSYTGPLMTYYDTSKPLTDQYRAARTQESEVFSPNSPATAEVSPASPLTCSSPQPSVEVSSVAATVTTGFTVTAATTTVITSTTLSPSIQKSSMTVFPVKKRLYSEIELGNSNKYQAPQVTPPPAHSQSASRLLPPELIILDSPVHNRIVGTHEISDKIVIPACAKVYNARKSAICEPIFKKSEPTIQHVSKKHHSIRTVQTNLNSFHEIADRHQQSSPVALVEYTNKCNPPLQTSPPSLKDTAEHLPQTYISRSSSGKKHNPMVNADNLTSPRDEDPKPERVQHTTVPVITSTYISNHQTRQEFSTKLPGQQSTEKSHQIMTTDNAQSVTESCAESIRPGRLHATSITSPSTAPEHLKTNSNSTLHGNDISYHRGPFSPLPPSSITMEHLALHGNLSNLSHVVDRFPTSERLLPGLASPASPFFSEKGLSPQYVFRQNVPSTLPTSVSSPSPAMTLLSQPSPPVMTIAYNHESQISQSPISFDRSVSELPSVLPNKVSNIQASYGRSVQDLSTILPHRSSSPISATTAFNRSMSELTTIHSSKTSSALNAQTAYRSVELPTVLPTKVATPVDLKSYQSVTDLSTLPNKVPIPPSIGVSSSYSRSATDYSLSAAKSLEAQPAPKQSRKRKSKQAAPLTREVPVITTTSTGTAFQQYMGLNSNPVSESSAIALKTATMLTGSAFNFGPAHTGLGLYTTEKDCYPGYLEDYRTTPSNYYIPASAPAPTPAPASAPAPTLAPDPSHDEINPAAHPTASAPTLPFSFTTHSRPSPYAIAQAFINHPSSLVDPTGTGPQLYQQYLHRRSEELLRQSGSSIVLQQSLLPPPASFTAGYHPALGIRQPYDSVNRPTWL